MARNSRPFEEESDAESIATDSTAPSEPRDEYPVDEILAERVDDAAGGLYYLLKWRGYPLHRASWEPPENLASDELVKVWEETKKRIALGEEEPFDVDAWMDRQHEIEAAEAEKHRRRKVKRRRRGLSVSSSYPSDGDYQDDELPARTPVRRRRSPVEPMELGSDDEPSLQSTKKVKAPVVHRKGVAQKLKRPNRRVAGSDEENGEIKTDRENDGPDGRLNNEKDSDTDSLFDEGSQPIYPDLDMEARAGPPGKKAVAKKKPPTSVPKSDALTEPAGARLKAATGKPAPPTMTIPAARSNMAKRSNNPFINGRKKPTKQRERVNGQTPKNSLDPQFNNLSMRGRMQKYSHNEPPPNISALTFIDPKTGKPQGAPKQTQVRGATYPIPSVYGRRSSPQEDRRRSYSRQSPEATRAASPAQDTLSYRGLVVGPNGIRTQTCRDWAAGYCRYSDEACRFAHWYIDPPGQVPPSKRVQGHQSPVGPPSAAQDAATSATPPKPWQPSAGGWAPKKSATCFYWHTAKAGCKFGEACEFAHEDTGVYSHLWHKLSDEQRARIMANKEGAPPPTTKTNPPTEQPTCFYWRKGRCRYSAEECRFAHFDTGIYMPDPYDKDLNGTRPVGAGTSANTTPMIGNRLQQHLQISHNSGEALEAHDASTSHAHVGSSQNGAQPIELPVEDISSSLQIGADVGHSQARFRCLTASEDEPIQFDAQLHMVAFKLFENLFSPVDQGVYLFPSRSVMAADVRKYCVDALREGRMWPAGSIEPKTQSVQVVDQLADSCKLRASGMLYAQDKYAVLIYPSNAEEWRFLDRMEASTSANASLRFCILPPTDILRPGKLADNTGIHAPIDPSPVVASVRRLLSPDDSIAFDSNRGPTKGSNVFLMWPTNRHAELQLLQRYFLALNCKVYASDTPGAWQYLRGRLDKNPWILIHRDVPLWKIRRLGDVMHRVGKSTNVFRVDSPSDLTAQGFTCERIFPYGSVTFITDDVFMHYPEKATDIVQTYIEAYDKDPARSSMDKLVARPGVRDWLLELLKGHTTKSQRQRCANLYQTICKLPAGMLISVPAEQLPTLRTLDEKRATDYTVEWFAGWSVSEVSNFRRFAVCHQSKEGEGDDASRGWEKKYQHLVFMRPSHILEMQKGRKYSVVVV